jgi:cytochrome c biogenesis protein CcmG/thiol:disulfide interchange protein DsbE
MRLSFLAVLLVLASLPLVAATPGPHPAPSFTLSTRNGTVSLDSLRGRVVLVDFWASWCGPCRGSFPWLKSLHERYAGDGLAIVAIDLDKDRTAAERFLEQFPAPFTVAFDPSGRTAESYRVRAMPTTFLVARDGTVLDTHAGFDPKRAPALENLVREACTP